MKMVEDGKIKLDDPVSKYIPSFANVKVGVEKKADDGSKSLELVPPDAADDGARSDDATPRASPTASMATAWSARPTRMLKYLCGRFRSRRIRRAHREIAAAQPAGRAAGNTAIPPTSWHAVMEIAAGKPLIEIDAGEAARSRSAWSTPRFFVTDPEKQKLLAQPVPNDSDFRVGRINDPTVVKKIQFASGGMVSTMADYRALREDAAQRRQPSTARRFSSPRRLSCW